VDVTAEMILDVQLYSINSRAGKPGTPDPFWICPVSPATTNYAEKVPAY